MHYTKVILITGGYEFIGSNLIGLLVNDNSNLVLCVDNLITGS